MTLNRGHRPWPDLPVQPLAGQDLAHRPRLLAEPSPPPSAVARWDVSPDEAPLDLPERGTFGNDA